ncbi:hypothetical protein H920_10006 [Fukomys damarensis]|uniref:Uncharacterized protein n=1 Tax=Fukomys damarensis TaxID=885580 RepID=A0A091DC06_FUKDA|nr:hypothetical protein H920_10006 [Fukomys damarensis]
MTVQLKTLPKEDFQNGFRKWREQQARTARWSRCPRRWTGQLAFCVQPGLQAVLATAFQNEVPEKAPDLRCGPPQVRLDLSTSQTALRAEVLAPGLCLTPAVAWLLCSEIQSCPLLIQECSDVHLLSSPVK